MDIDGFEIDDFSMIIDNGVDYDIDMKRICCCQNACTITRCLESCQRYYSCDNIALASDILTAYEETPPR